MSDGWPGDELREIASELADESCKYRKERDEARAEIVKLRAKLLQWERFRSWVECRDWSDAPKGDEFGSGALGNMKVVLHEIRHLIDGRAR